MLLETLKSRYSGSVRVNAIVILCPLKSIFSRFPLAAGMTRQVGF